MDNARPHKSLLL